MKLIGLGLIIVSVLVFWGCFFKLTPWIVSLIPLCGGWEKLIGLAIYIAVGYFGGFGVPLVLLVLGVYLILTK